MDTFVPVGVVPVRQTVLVPRDGTAEGRGCLTKMASLKGVKSGPLMFSAMANNWGWPYSRNPGSINWHIPKTKCTTSSGASSPGSGFDHLRRMSAADLLRATDRIAQGLDVGERRSLELAPQCGPALRVDLGILRNRSPVQGIGHGVAQLGELLLVDDVLENT